MGGWRVSFTEQSREVERITVLKLYSIMSTIMVRLSEDEREARFGGEVTSSVREIRRPLKP
jgi:hypothetical protein